MLTKKWTTNLAAAYVLAAVFYTTVANAVGFGDITLNTALNEPLDAEISLTNSCTPSVKPSRLLCSALLFRNLCWMAEKYAKIGKHSLGIFRNFLGHLYGQSQDV